MEKFDDLTLPHQLITALKKQNITVPTDVQQKVIPLALKNLDLIVQSETGTGKTLAYLLPLFMKIDVEKKEMQAIILAPTYELAIQIQRQIELLSENAQIGIRSVPIIGNVNKERQITKLKEKPHIITGTPSRILELIKARKITAHTIRTIVFDEADRLLDENNLEAVKAVLHSTLRDRQMMMFSATMQEGVIARAKEMMKDPVVIKPESLLTVPSTIEHVCFFAEQRDKIEVLRKLLHIYAPFKALIFVNETGQIDNVTTKIAYHGFEVESIQGANNKLERKKAMDNFKAGKMQLLVASDLAARGLDITGVTHVINMGIPQEPKDYLHRVGRTGRNGNTGIAISIVTGRELNLIKIIEKTLHIQIKLKDMSHGKIIDARKQEI